MIYVKEKKKIHLLDKVTCKTRQTDPTRQQQKQTGEETQLTLIHKNTNK
jgi:hypothetical protein